MGFININKIGNTYFDRRKLHLNKSETSILIKEFSKVVNL